MNTELQSCHLLGRLIRLGKGTELLREVHIRRLLAENESANEWGKGLLDYDGWPNEL
jgi:hypothetical protein